MNIAQVKSFHEIYLYRVHLTTWKANPGFNVFLKKPLRLPYDSE